MSDVIIVTEEAEGSVVLTEYPGDNSFSTEEVGTEVILTEGREVTIVTPGVPEVVIVHEMLQGPQGVPGLESGGLVRYPVAYAMSGHRIVVINGDGNAIYASKDTTAHGNKVLGMTKEAVISGNVLIQTSGVIEEPSWSWTLDVPVWLSVDGLMTQVVPVSGFSLIVGFPISATSMVIDIREPIFLS